MAYNTQVTFEIKFNVKKVKVLLPNGFAVVRATLKNSSGYEDGPLPNEIDTTGMFGNVFAGDQYQAKVRFVENEEYGYSLKTKEGTIELLIPHTKKELVKFLKRRCDGVGEKVLGDCIDHIGINIISKVSEDPDILLSVPGLTEKKRNAITEACQNSRYYEDLVLFVQSLNLNASVATKVFEKFGTLSMYKIKEDPYSIYRADGVTFKEADTMAYNYGKIFWSDIKRLECIILAILDANEINGNTCCLKDNVIKSVNPLIQKSGVFPMDQLDEQQIRASEGFKEEDIKKAITNLKSKKEITEDIDENGQAVLAKTATSSIEKSLAEMITKKVGKNVSNPMCAPVKAINALFDTHAFKDASDEQRKAIVMAIRNKMSILTGGPGTGKTYTVNLIVKAIETLHPKAEVVLLAPTGRAAYRMTQVSGKQAKTIHSALHIYNREEADNGKPFELQADYVIVDEASMIDQWLFLTLLKSLNDKTSILFVGDENQLPSVSCGNVLGDMLKTECIERTRLNRIFRQSGTSNIVTNAHRIKGGNIEEIKNMTFTDDKGDFQLVECSLAKCADLTVEEYKKRLAKSSIEDVIIISPMRKGEVGSIELNSKIQKEVNPLKKGQMEYKVGMKTFRINDRVIHIKNNSDLNVVNGALGTIMDIYYDDQLKNITIEVLYDNEEDTKKYHHDDLEELELGYCITVHKSQGSEIKHVIMPCNVSLAIMLRRNLMYTAITRAKETFTCVGDKELFIKGCSQRSTQRKTMLTKYINSKK